MYKLLAVLICVLNCALFANNNSLSGLINFDQNDRSLNSYETLLSHLKSLEQHNKSEAIKALIKQSQLLIKAKNALHESSEKLKSKTLKVGSKNIEILELRDSSILYNSAGKEKDASLNKMPTSFYYALLKQVNFPDYLDASFSYAAFHGDLKSAQQLMNILKKGKKQTASHIYTFHYFSKLNDIIKTGKLLEKASAQIKTNDIAAANNTLSFISQTIIRSPIQKSLFTPEIKQRHDIILRTINKVRQAELLLFADFPLEPDQRMKVKCLNYPEFQYDVYLPPQYKHDGSVLLPIMYTFSPGGGGMVGHFKKMAQEKGIILIGNLESKNNQSYDLIKNSWYAIQRDIKSRIHFEPGRQFAAGMSGGAATTYVFARRFYSQISGAIPMGGWLGFNTNPNDHWQLSGYKVVRTCGNNDKGAKSYIKRDKDILATHNIEIKDLSFNGGHSPAPYPVQINAIDWLLEKRPLAKDQQAAEKFYLQSASLIHSKLAGTVLVDSLSIMRNQPYTWTSFRARKLYEEVLYTYGTEISKFKNNLSNISMDRLTIDTFGEDMYGAALVGDHQTFWACLTILEQQKGLDLHLKTATWQLTHSKYEKIKNRQKARELFDSKKKLTLDETIVKASLAIAENKKDEYLKLKKEIESRIEAREEKYSKKRYEEVLKQVNTL
ncbi:phosphoglycerate kinase [Lentisphaera araneosa HTCC2155]|uniref:Phosphoglycerate kinase n=1 Tax=Lentisphaera araneosa HTCC2155 TaxID=313628 RepID=A6DQK4_9BACT|nr:hypothetical protein [Lentisphaera araneosa]EDM26085.1 phosphoglycerate kinase [Lentisphaera araneosa HTCC2155]